MGRPYEGFRGRLGRPSVTGALVEKDGPPIREDPGEDRATRPCLFVLYGEDIRWLKPHKLKNMGRPYEGFRGRLGRPSVAGALVDSGRSSL